MMTTNDTRNTWRWVLAIGIVLGALFDMITFFRMPHLWAFETNPLYILTKSWVPLFIVKIAICAWFAFNAINPLPKGNTMRYTYVLAVLYLIVLQIFGGFSNLSVQAVNPSPDQAMPPQQAMTTYYRTMAILYVIPMLFGIVAFKLFELGNYRIVKDEVQK